MTLILSPVLASLAAFLALAMQPVCAQATMDQQQQQLSTVEQQLRSAKSEQLRIAAEVAAAISAQEAISAKLVQISAKVLVQESAISDSETGLAMLTAEQVSILAKLGEKQDTLSELLAGLQRLEQNPPPALVVEPNDVLGALRGAMMFGAIVPELRAEAATLASDLARLDELRTGIKLRRTALQAEIASLETARRALDGLVQRKKELVASGNKQLEVESKKAVELAEQAKSLGQLVASLAAETKRFEAARAAAAESERRKQEALAQKPRIDFASARGRLAYPAQGQILKTFGDADGLGGAIQGTIVATRSGAQVTAPADGHVEFAGPFRSYGEVLILNPGGGYHILLAGMAKITAGTGEFLRAGEPVGQMGDGPSSVTLLGEVVEDKRPILYIEFRNNSEAIDSASWWIGGMREARG